MSIIDLLKQAFERSLNILIDGFSEAIPKLILVLIILLVFWMVAKLAKTGLSKALKLIKLDEMFEKIELSPILSQIGIKSATNFFGAILYWTLMFMGFLVIAEVINMPTLTSGLAAVMGYLPKLLIALVIMVLGMFLANMIKGVVYSATHSIGLKGAKVISNIIYYVLFIFIAITAINQTGVDTSIITQNVTLIFGAMLLAFGISYGIASRQIMSNMLSSFYRKDKFKIGMHIKIKDVEGKIVDIDSLSITIDTGEKNVVLPTSLLVEEQIEISK